MLGDRADMMERRVASQGELTKLEKWANGSSCSSTKTNGKFSPWDRTISCISAGTDVLGKNVAAKVLSGCLDEQINMSQDCTLVVIKAKHTEGCCGG